MSNYNGNSMLNQTNLHNSSYQQQMTGTGTQVSTRKKRRGMIEKRRRDKINSSLYELRRLVPAAFEKQGSAKLEKAEILQMTVDYLRMLHSRGLAESLTTSKSLQQSFMSSEENQDHQLGDQREHDSVDSGLELGQHGPASVASSLGHPTTQQAQHNHNQQQQQEHQPITQQKPHSATQLTSLGQQQGVTVAAVTIHHHHHPSIHPASQQPATASLDHSHHLDTSSSNYHNPHGPSVAAAALAHHHHHQQQQGSHIAPATGHHQAAHYHAAASSIKQHHVHQHSNLLNLDHQTHHGYHSLGNHYGAHHTHTGSSMASMNPYLAAAAAYTHPASAISAGSSPFEQHHQLQPHYPVREQPIEVTSSLPSFRLVTD